MRNYLEIMPMFFFEKNRDKVMGRKKLLCKVIKQRKREKLK